nr:hypothetical protein HmN_000592900 [Hymenolepis microstoma]CUU98165.1 hypothetical transcript [Hymenolepis microstoma]
MPQDMKFRIQKILDTYNIDIFTIMESNLSDDKLTYYQFSGYILHLLPKDQQAASGILTGVKEGLASRYEIIKSMSSMQDICEVIRLDVWKSQNDFKMYAVYSPPQKRFYLELFNISYKTLLLEDFNAHSKRWGYGNRNTAGKEIKDILNSSPLKLTAVRILLHTFSTLKPEQRLTCLWFQATSASSHNVK